MDKDKLLTGAGNVLVGLIGATVLISILSPKILNAIGVHPA